MKRIFLFMAMSTTIAAHALPSPPGHSRLIDGDPAAAATPPSPVVEFRANQINRCTDADGRVKLQDTPCAPVALPAVTGKAAASTAGLVELSALPPRSIGQEERVRASPSESRSLVDVALSASWKLALFAAAGYAIFRMVRAWRDAYAFRAALDEAPRRSRQ